MSLNCSEVQEYIGRMRIQAVLKSFHLSSSFAREFSKALTVHRKVPTNFTFNFSISSSNLTAPSFSRRIEESCRSVLIMNFDTAKQLWSNGCVSMSIQILSWISTLLVDKFTTCFGRGLPLQQVSLCLCPIERFQWKFLLTFPWRIYWFHSQYEPMRLFGLETRVQSWYQHNNVLRKDTVLHPRLGRFSYSNESTFSVGMFSSLEVVCILENGVCIASDPYSIVMKNCHFPITFKKPASEHSFDNFWSPRISANFRSYSCNRSTCANDVELWDMALVSGISVGITKDSQISPSRACLANVLHTHLRLFRRYWADWQKQQCEESIQRFSSLPLLWIVIFPPPLLLKFSSF